MNERSRLLDRYSAQVYRNRKEHVVQVEDPLGEQQIAANTRTIPGIITNRGCCYAGCKGVVVGPLKDCLIITHGPIGCAFYSWGTRRNKATSSGEGGQNYLAYCFSTDMQEADIVFGGEKKLEKAIDEAVEIFHPKCVMICATCPVGLIGDDIHAVARRAEKKHGVKCIAFSCEGYRGVSQSAGHHIANNGLMEHVIGTGNKKPKSKYSLNILGEYNIGGDGWEEMRILKKIGYEVVSVFTGDGSYETIRNAHLADLNLVMCHRSINYVAEMMKTRYGMNWLKVNFIGIAATVKSLRDIAEYFGDPELVARTEQVIREELDEIEDEVEYYRGKLKGKKAGIFAGGSRAHHYQALLEDFGVETFIAGYEFAHRDDYEGRQVLPFIKEDADSKNIENLEVEPDPVHFRPRKSEEELKALVEKIPVDTYGGMIRDMREGHVVIDDFNHYETEAIIRMMKPDIFFSGIKDRYIIQKCNVPSRQIHSYDYSGPYAGFKGAVNFARDVAMAIYSNAWAFVVPPWKTRPVLEGALGGE